MTKLPSLYPDYRKTGFEYKVIHGQHCIGMKGNLDTVHDVLIKVFNHGIENECEEIAHFIVEKLNEEVLDDQHQKSDGCNVYGHDWELTWFTDENYTEYYKCDICGKEEQR